MRDDDQVPFVAYLATTLSLLLLLLAAQLVAGCRPPPPKCPVAPPVEVVTVRTDCLAGPPPEPPGSLLEACEGHGACLTEDGLRQLATYLSTLQRYSLDAWTNCGPLPASPEKKP